MQQGMLFASLEAPQGAGVYIEQAAAELREPYDRGAFAEAWARVMARHDALRLAFSWSGGVEARQHIAYRAKPVIVELALAGLSTSEAEDRFTAFLEDDRRQGIDLSKAPLHRTTVLLHGPASWRFVWTVHHALVDGRAIATVLREVMSLYDALRQDRQPAPLPPATSFTAHAQALGEVAWDDAATFWRALAGPIDEPCTLPLPAPAPPAQRAPYCNLQTRLDATATRALETFAAEQGVTVATLVHGAWALLLHHYTGQSPVSFGVTRAVRPIPTDADEARVGLYINTLPLIVPVMEEDRLGNWLRTLRAAWLAQRPHACTPLPLVQQASALPGGTALFDTYTVFERGTLDDLIHAGLPGTRTRRFTLHERTPAPLTLAVYHNTMLEVQFEYDTARFGSTAIQRLAGHLTTLLTAFPSAAGQPVLAVQYLPDAERARLLPPAPPVPSVAAVHDAITVRAARAPKAIAVQHRNVTLSYGALEARSNQLAHALCEHGVAPGDTVAFCLPRSIDAIVSLLAILKAGAAYLPVDTTLPRERKAFLCTDSRAVLVIGDDADLAGLGDLATPKFSLTQEHTALLRFPVTPPARAVHADDPAYIIYTSGSTGQPKGVVVPHGAIAAFVDGARTLYGIHRRDRVLQFAALSFDAAAEEIFPTLVRGARLVLRTDEMIASATGFVEQCRAWRITVLDLPTAFWHLLVDALDRIEWPPRLRLVIIGGEAARADKAEHWRSFVDPHVQLANTYGPTETTVAVTCAFLERESGEGPVPIGLPFPHVTAYILSPTQSPVPDGVPGELCIGGPQLALGYLGREQQTAAAFVAAPWDATLRLYRTGDRVYRRDDGALVYIGRLDRQVKLRGFRIELGEIETVLQSHPDVEEAVVMLREDRPGVPELCGYVVPLRGVNTATLEGQLRTHLHEALPAYMHPAHLALLDAIPMTPSGKLDRKALPAPQRELGRRASPPRTPTEQAVLTIWREVIGLAELGCDDPFLAIGGHSLLAVQILTRIAVQFGVTLPPAAFVQAPTVAQLAALIDDAPTARTAEIPPVDPHAPLRLSPDQEILWIYESVFPGTPAYHIPVAFRLSGPLDIPCLQEALARVIARHEPLRTVFGMAGDAPAMFVRREVLAAWRIENGEDAPGVVRAWLSHEAVRPFDIAQGPLLRGAVLCIHPEVHIVCLTLHHLIADGWSVGVLTHEWAAAYTALRQNTEPDWKPLSLRYADYAAWRAASQPTPGDEADCFWRRQLAPPVPCLHWPAKESDEPNLPQGAQYPVHFPRALSEALAHLAQEQNATPFSVLFVLLAIAVQRLTRQEDALLGFTLAGRGRADLEPLVGFFIATLLLRIETRGDMAFSALLRSTRDDLLEAQQHDHMPFARLRAIAHTQETEQPLLQVLFLMQSMDLPPLALPGTHAQTLNVDLGKALTDLTLELYPGEDGFTGWFEYQTALFDRATIARLAALLVRLGEHCAAHPHALLETMPTWEDCPLMGPVEAATPLTAPAPPKPIHFTRTDAAARDSRPPDPLERRLLQQFKRVLRVRRVTVHDNFFDLGGHSLLAIQLLDRIDRHFGVRLSPVHVYQAPTVRALAQFIRADGALPVSRVVEFIQPEGDRTPLFFVGSTDMVPPLLPHIDEEQPIHGLNIFGLLPERGPVPALTVEAIARVYIEEIRKVQPEGPYRFAAYCRDTMLALEVAQQLRAADCCVDRLIMIDFFWDSTPRYPRPVRHFMNLYTFGPAYAREKFREAARQVYERYARLRARLAQRGQRAAAVPALSETNRNTAFINAYYDAIGAYNVSPYPGHIHVILVTEWGLNQVPEWEEVATGGVTLHLLKACHHNLWNAPQDQDLATLLGVCLE
jgi:amino acid adenylation domain-containing protein